VFNFAKGSPTKSGPCISPFLDEAENGLDGPISYILQTFWHIKPQRLHREQWSYATDFTVLTQGTMKSMRSLIAALHSHMRNTTTLPLPFPRIMVSLRFSGCGGLYSLLLYYGMSCYTVAWTCFHSEDSQVYYYSFSITIIIAFKIHALHLSVPGIQAGVKKQSILFQDLRSCSK